VTRTDAILKAIRERLEERRSEIDKANGMRGLTLDLKFSPGCLEPREVIDRVERGGARA
jgi:hypothetical protein